MRSRIVAAAGMLLLTASLFVGCDEPRSQVAAVEPTGNDVPSSTPVVRVHFDRGMDSSTIIASSYIVEGSSSGVHEGVFEFPSADVAMFWTITGFVDGETVTVRLTKEIESLSPIGDSARSPVPLG